MPPSIAAPVRGKPRLVAGLVLLTTIVLGVVTSSAEPAAAHATLIASDPHENAALEAPPTRVALTFSEQVEQRFARVEVSGPDGSAVEGGEVGVDGAQVVAPLEGPSQVGTYRVSYHVVSADSHPIEGEFAFEVRQVTGAATASPEAVPAPQAPEPTASRPSPAATELDAAPTVADAEGGTRLDWLLPVAAALVAVGAAILLLRRRRGAPSGD